MRAVVRPLPLQDGGIPLWIAGAGEKVTLKIAAQYATTPTSPARSRSSTTRARSSADTATAIGRDFGEITRSSNFNTIVGATEAEAADRLAAVKARLLPFVGEKRADTIEQDYLASDGYGSVEQVAERLAARAAHGLGYAIHYFPEAAHDLSGVELFEREVIRALR